MARADTPRSARSPELYRRIHYATELEATALERLAELDVEGCRAAFGALVGQLSLEHLEGRNGGQDSEVVPLLLDVLQKVNRRVHRAPQDDAAYQDRRVALIEEFSRCSTAVEARNAFLPAVNHLLARLNVRGTPHPLVERAQRYIDEHYHERIFLSSVALKLNVSPNYLSRLFRKETGTTLTGYIQTKRLEHARLLLAEGKHSISEIAYLVGYQHYRDFYRNFVKREKASPREVQRRLAGSLSRKTAGRGPDSRPSVL